MGSKRAVNQRDLLSTFQSNPVIGILSVGKTNSIKSTPTESSNADLGRRAIRRRGRPHSGDEGPHARPTDRWTGTIKPEEENGDDFHDVPCSAQDAEYPGRVGVGLRVERGHLRERDGFAVHEVRDVHNARNTFCVCIGEGSGVAEGPAEGIGDEDYCA